jgi:orotidine-5'-phosphate decarboxylase
MQFNQMLRENIRRTNSLVCVGLDADPVKIPSSLGNKTDSIFQFLEAVVEATSDLVVAYKPNLAFYECLGIEGWDVLQRTLRIIPEGIIKIGDAKRGDIGLTAEKYAKALFDLGFDAVTVNPYLGWDAVEPFLRDETKGCFILCLTSNPSSKDFQYLSADGKFLYQHVAEKAVQWNVKNNCGLVVGATHPEELKIVRGKAPGLPFLIPGVGAQGGDLEASVLNGTDGFGETAVINSSRGILYASSGPDFAEAARRETLRLRDTINAIRVKKTGRRNVEF